MKKLLALFFAFMCLGTAQSPGDPPLCPVQVTYRPTWPWWMPAEQRFRRITVSLKPGCPHWGIARLYFKNSASGRTLPETGYYVLVGESPSLDFPLGAPQAGSMPTWQVYTLDRGGVPHLEPQVRR